MDSSPAGVLPFGPVRQVAFVTRSIADSMRHYSERLGIGPWFLAERASFAQCRYRGEDCDIQIAAALASAGGVQFELVQPLDDDPSAFRAWMDRPFARELQHHVAFWVDDYAAAMRWAAEIGYVVEQDGATAWGPFAYLLHPDAPDHLIEFTEATPERRALNQAIADAAVGWDGSNPVRSLADAVSTSTAS